MAGDTLFQSSQSVWLWLVSSGQWAANPQSRRDEWISVNTNACPFNFLKRWDIDTCINFMGIRYRNTNTKIELNYTAKGYSHRTKIKANAPAQ